jgi:hypothetical protein
MTGHPTVMVATWSDGVSVFSGGTRTRAFEGQPTHCVAGDGQGGAYVIVGSGDVWAWSPGRDWRLVASCDTALSCCIEVGGRLLAGTDDARVLELSGGRWSALEGLDATPGRDRWYAGTAVIDGEVVGPPLGIRSMAASCDGAVLLANVHVGGVPRSTDGGRTWQPTLDIDDDAHQVAAHPSRQEIVAVAAAAGLGVSGDGGATWSLTSEGLHASHCSATAVTEDWVLVSASVDPFAPEGALYRRRIGSDGPLERVGGGLPEWLGGKIDTYCMAASGDDVAFVDWSGALYGSHDQGESWSRWAEGFAAPSGVFIC